MSEEVLYESHPAMFQNNPLGFILSCALCVVGVGILILLVWKIKTLGTTIIVTDERVTLRKGILSRHTNDVFHEDIRNVQISQSFFQRIFNVGNIGIASSGHSDIEITASGLPDPYKIKEIIDRYRAS